MFLNMLTFMANVITCAIHGPLLDAHSKYKI